VQGHQARLSQITRRLAASQEAESSGAGSAGFSGPAGRDQPTSLTDLVVSVVKEVLRANEQLQQRLTLAEAQLERQTAEIAAHLSQALTDNLTGLPNRRAFDEQLGQRIEAYSRYTVPFSLLLIDIDYFKKINDTHGHVAGDHVLSEIATVLRAALRKPDFVARYGGEEFAAILPYTSLEDAVHAARHTRLAVEAATTLFDDRPIRVTTSVGLAAILDEDDSKSILKRADDALYASKRGGRNCGHQHDGMQCLRIADEDEPSGDADGLTASAAEPLAPELEAACAELRDFAAMRP
jgi:diguanylate cyclase